MAQGPRFDANIDWIAYDQPQDDDPEWSDVTSTDSFGSGSRVSRSTRSLSPAPSSVPGPYLPPHRRRGEGDAVLGPDGQVGRVSRRGAFKNLGGEPDIEGSFRKVQRVPYALTKKELAFLKERFPNTFFQVYKDQNHDHGLAHLETMIATRHVFDTIPDGSAILDLYGNPAARDSFMMRRDLRGRTMETVVTLATEKDYVRRATKWGSPVDQDGVPRYHEMTIDDLLHPDNHDWVSQFDVFTLFHTGYYISMDKLAALLSIKERSVAKMVIHRHPLEQGQMFDGELEYVNRHGFVVQRNIETGERYVHSSLEWMFQSTTKVWRGATHAISWSFHKVSVDTWILDVVACPLDLDERYTAYVNSEGSPRAAADRMNRDALIDTAMTIRPPSFPGAEVERVAGVLLVRPSGRAKPLRITNTRFFDYLAASVVGKARNKDTLEDLFALARRENALTSSFPTAKRFSVPHDEVADHVVAAFLNGVDAEAELLNIVSMFKQERGDHTRALRDNLSDISSGAGKVRTAIEIAKTVNTASRSKDRVGAILDFIEAKVV